ncbi:MAG: hypothetical protein ACRCVN_01470 [Spirochaetia bacterium]
MKKIIILLTVLSVLACSHQSLPAANELMIAPVVIDADSANILPRLDLISELGFNTVVFIGAGTDLWAELTLQAHGRGLYAVFMTEAQDSAKVVDYLLSSGVAARIDGVWLSQGNYFDRKDIKKIQQGLRKLQSEVKDRKSLGQLFIQSNEASTASLLQNGKLVEGVIYYDHSAAGLLGLLLGYEGQEREPELMGVDIAKMYNWRNFYAKAGHLLVPLTLNFSYAFKQEAVSDIAVGLMNSVSGPLYMPIALNGVDATFYEKDLQVIKTALQIRKDNASLYRGKQSNLAYNNGVYIDIKEDGREQILAVFNLMPTQVQYRLPYLRATKLKNNIRLKNIKTGQVIHVTGSQLVMDLGPYESGYWRIEKK